MTLACRAIALILLLLLIFGDSVTSQNTLEFQLRLLLRRWRGGYQYTGIIPLPSLKPLKIPDVTHSYDGKGIKMTYTLRKMEIIGLDSFIIKELKVLEARESLEMSISLSIPKYTLYAEHYDLKGRAYLMYPLKGAGTMTATFRDTDLYFKIRLLSRDDSSTRIGDFRFNFNVQQIEANLVGSSWPINKVLNSEGVEILANYHDEIERAMWNYVVPYVDYNLVNITVAQIVRTILNTK